MAPQHLHHLCQPPILLGWCAAGAGCGGGLPKRGQLDAAAKKGRVRWGAPALPGLRPPGCVIMAFLAARRPCSLAQLKITAQT